MTDNDAILAARVAGLLDLTSLNEDDDEARIRALCERALGPLGAVAAVCVYPRFVALARRELDARGGQAVRVATVCNFPGGTATVEAVVAEVRDALVQGADEIDVVYPYRALLAGDREAGPTLLAAVRQACAGKTLKVIVESGELVDPLLIRLAGEQALAAGADFLKTSTGKVPVNATAQAAQTLLSVIVGHGGRAGFKPAGGMRTLADALIYLWLAERLLGSDWVNAQHLRFGASSLLDDLLQHAGLDAGSGAAGGY